jgi:predicted acyl esterase
MRLVADGRRPVRTIEAMWITLPDGCRLAARVWRPVEADTDPVPAILEYRATVRRLIPNRTATARCEHPSRRSSCTRAQSELGWV